jgi:iron complex transport system substrate-binding protein
MRRWESWSLLVGLVAVVGLFAAAREVVDPLGRVVPVPDQAQRIASPYGMGTYYLYALGAKDRIVAGWYIGLRTANQAPEALRRLDPNLATKLRFGDPNVEDVAALGVDLILADATRYAAFTRLAREVGFPVLEYRVETFADMASALRVTGQALGGEAEARGDALARKVEETLAALAAATAGLGRPRVLFSGTDTLCVASGTMFQTLLIEAAGGASVSAGLAGSWNEVSLEQVLVWDPEVILLAPYSAAEPKDLLADPNWQRLSAVASGRVFKMPRLIAPWDTPVPDALLGLLWLAEVLHPGALGIDLCAEVLAFHRETYGLELSAEELAGVGCP